MINKHLYLSFFAIYLSINGILFSQQDFNVYKVIQAQGQIPVDFVVKSAAKVQADMQKENENLSNREKKIFLEGVHYGVDELLQSGLVIYGDEISEYVTKVAKKLLESNPQLSSELRFYTLKSNVSNALSTDQGIVFVTTGLISQLTSEAQLAYVLAHEISHYTEKHVVESFEYRTRKEGLRDQIKQLSTYSREKEFEADILGIELYAKAGYSKKYITTTFDVLMYSYLPIDEIELPVTYFNTDLCFVPISKFPDKKYPIKAEENYDDSQSSHPNIQNRKAKALETVNKQPSWGTTDNFFGADKFKYIRDICRFERVRMDIMNSEYANALYTIFILEKQFPNSLYLDRMKAQSWLGLSTFKQGGSIFETVNSTSSFEGEGAAMHFFIRSLKEAELTTLSMRIVEDCRKKHPNDKEINAIWQRTTKNLYDSKIKINQLSNKTFQEAIDFVVPEKLVDTLIRDNQKESETKDLNKYEKIKLKKNVVSNSQTTNEIDSVHYYLYNLSDFIESDLFKIRWEDLRKNEKIGKEAENEFNSLSRSAKKKALEKEAKTDISEFILIEPAAISYKKGDVNYKGSDELEERFKSSFAEIASQLDLKVHQIGKSNLEEIGTNGFNEKSLFTALLIQLSNNDKLAIFPVDYSQLNEIKMRYGTDKLVFSIIEHSYQPKFKAVAALLAFFPPALIGYLPVAFIKGNNTEISLIVLDISESKITNGARYSFNEPASKNTIKARVYDILQTINSEN